MILSRLLSAAAILLAASLPAYAADPALIPINVILIAAAAIVLVSIGKDPCCRRAD